MAALQNQFTSQISGLSNEMREIERKQNEAFTNALQRQGAELRGEIQQQRTELTNMINYVQQRIEAKEQNHRQIAEFLAEQAGAYIKAEAYQSAISAARAAYINSCINDAKLSEVTMCEERVQTRVDF